MALRAERQFIHNSKITSSAINEKKAFAKTRQRNKPQGRYMGMPQMLHQLLGHCDVHTTLTFEPIETRPFEYRARKCIKLDQKGNLMANGKRRTEAADVASIVTESCSLREKVLPASRHFSDTQRLTLQDISSGLYDKVTAFGIRPVELVELCPRLREYYEWFRVSDKVMKGKDISRGLKLDVTQCLWIDGVGRRVYLRKQALSLVRKKLESIEEADVQLHSWTLRCHLLNCIGSNEMSDDFIWNVRNRNGEDEKLPIVVFSRISPNRSTHFLLHIMLVLGEYVTELDLRSAGSMKMSFVKAKLIPNEDLDSLDMMKTYANILKKRVIEEILPLQPVSMNQMEDFISKTSQLIDAVLLRNAIPITDMPPSILTELFNEKTKALDNEWKERTECQLDSILENMKDIEGLPTKDDVLTATKAKVYDWDPLSIKQFEGNQSDESYAEQKMALTVGINAVNKYCKQFQNQDYTKGVLTNGAPGAGKTFVLQAEGLYAMTKGLRVMSTSLMAVRSIAMGGYHLHRLFQWEVGKVANLFRLAEVSSALMVQCILCSCHN